MRRSTRKGAFDPPFALDHGPISAGVSICIARSRCDGDDLQRLGSRADLALQAAKKAGRHMFRLFAPEMEACLQARRDLIEDLRHAIARDQFHLVYQPLVSLGTVALIGFEALLRWTHPQRGAISPSEFIPLAEETGIIGALGDWVLAEACREASGWPPGITVSVNLSPVQLRKPGFALDVIRILGRFGMSPGRLKLEVTETALLADERMARETLTTLKQLGIEISLDDFGTGYSSLNHLRLMPLDRIKIDRSFIAGLDRNNGAAAIVAAVLSLARNLDMETVAEGYRDGRAARLAHRARLPFRPGLLLWPPGRRRGGAAPDRRHTGWRRPAARLTRSTSAGSRRASVA